MINQRSSAVLCHLSSLPSLFGIGDLGPEAYRFVDFLCRAGFTWWQILPISPTDQGSFYSPYSSVSAFAANHLFISPELLVEEGFLDKKDLEGIAGGAEGPAEYEKAARIRESLLAEAYRRYQERKIKFRDFESFCVHEGYWLDDYALYVVLKKHFKGSCWHEWPVVYRDRHPEALKNFTDANLELIERERFIQYLFCRQWRALQEYCSRKSIGLIGDIPIYVNYDSVDVWVHPEIFKLDAQKRQTVVAGVPPDYYSEIGQRWGNPVYNWEKLKATEFSWWVDRIYRNLALFDAIRIDHFRAFVQCWEIPVEEKTAVKGAWRDVPGKELFLALQKHFRQLPIIAENLGIITKDVDELMELFGFPGMRVLMFAFHNEYKKSRDLPENYTPLSVAFTGTHDNNTIRGWFENDMTPVEKENLQEFLGYEPSSRDISWIMIELVMESQANLAIIPLQDLLGLGEQARMNRPSTVEGNWLWRFPPGVLGRSLCTRVSKIISRSHREVGVGVVIPDNI
jgi:4-alpha-glucanotransferase